MRRRLRQVVASLVAALAMAMAVPGVAQESNAPTSGRTGVRLPAARRGRPDGAMAPTAEEGRQPVPLAPAASTPPATSPKSPSSTLDVVHGQAGDLIAMEFYGLDIDHLLRLLMKAAHVTILKSDQVTGPFTIIAPDQVPIDVAFQIVNSALEMRGFTMMKTDLGLYKVVPIAQASQSGPALRFGDRPEELPAGDEIITQVMPLRNLSASEMASQMRPLMSDQARVVATSTNSLIITDTASNLSRVMTMINELEAQLADGYQVFYLQYYDATEMATLVTSIVLGRGGGAGAAGPRQAWERRVVGGPPQAGARAPVVQQVAAAGGPEFCYPDVRTNALIVLATPLHGQQIRELIEQLDRPVNLRDTYYVYPVQNLVASQLADLVGPLVNAEVRAAAGTGGTSTSRTTSTRRTTTGTQSRTSGTTRPTPIRTGSAALSPEAIAPESEFPVAATARELEPLAGEGPPRPSAEPLMMAQTPEGMPFGPPERAAQPQPSVEAGPAMEEAYSPGTYGQATITADDNTNVLLISASPDQMDLIKQLLEKLDVLPPQVHIQAIIAEVTVTRDTSLGFQWEGLKALYKTPTGSTFGGTFGTDFGIVSTDKDGNPVYSSGFTGIINGPDDFQAVLNALTTDSHARVLSTPGVFTTSGQEASIDVSSRRPFPRGTLSSSVSGEIISTAMDWESVGIVLTVTPRVTSGDVVQMDVQVSADEPGASVKVGGQDYPTTQRRAANATMYVKTGNTAILGGLMRDTIRRTASRVPLLGDLPLIGSLFSSTTSKREKSELLVFLTPRVVRTPSEAAQLTEEQRDKLGEVPKSLQKPADGSQPPK